MLPTDTGWIAQCPVFGCQELLEIEPGPDGHYRFSCDGPHSHDDVVQYLQCDTRLDPIRSTRAWRALMLAPTPDVWQALLEGQEVPIDQLDPEWAKRFGL